MALDSVRTAQSSGDCQYSRYALRWLFKIAHFQTGTLSSETGQDRPSGAVRTPAIWQLGSEQKWRHAAVGRGRL